MLSIVYLVSAEEGLSESTRVSVIFHSNTALWVQSVESYALTRWSPDVREMCGTRILRRTLCLLRIGERAGVEPLASVTVGEHGLKSVLATHGRVTVSWELLCTGAARSTQMSASPFISLKYLVARCSDQNWTRPQGLSISF